MQRLFNQFGITGQRTAQHWAQTIKWLCDGVYPQAEKIVLVQDNLNTHTPASLYEAFTPEEAMRLKERIEWHYCFAPPLGAHRCAAACGWLPRPSVHPSMGAGSTWLRSRSVWRSINAWTDASATK